MAWRPQVAALEASANVVTAPELSSVWPTAVQVVADGQDPAKRFELIAPAGFCVVWAVHVVPSHASANVPADAPLAPPNAAQVVAEVHDTPASCVFGEPAGLGGNCMIQLLPVKRSAKAKTVEALLTQNPTAVQAVAEVHDTAFSALEVAFAGDGAVIRVQLPALQRSASDLEPEPLSKLPTAIHAVEDGHDTPSSRVVCAPVTLTVAWILHVGCSCSPRVRSVPVLFA